MLAELPRKFAANATPVTADYVCAGGAIVLAAKIREYWEEKGSVVEVWIEPFDIKNRARARSFRYLDRAYVPGGTFAVRSDMIGGLPRKMNGADSFGLNL